MAFAGNELRGAPVTNHLAVWQERLWIWGVPLLLVVLLGGVIRWVLRRRNYPRRPPRRLPMINTQPFQPGGADGGRAESASAGFDDRCRPLGKYGAVGGGRHTGGSCLPLP